MLKYIVEKSVDAFHRNQQWTVDDESQLAPKRKTYAFREKLEEKMEGSGDAPESACAEMSKYGIKPKAGKGTEEEQWNQLRKSVDKEHATFNYSSSSSSSSDENTSDNESLKNKLTSEKNESQWKNKTVKNSSQEGGDDSVVFDENSVGKESVESFQSGQTTSDNMSHSQSENNLLEEESTEDPPKYKDGAMINARAVLQYRRGQCERALHEFKWAAKHCGSITAYYNAGVCFQEKNDSHKAARYFKVAAESDHAAANYNMACLILSNLELFGNDYRAEDAIKFREKAADLGLKSPDLVFCLGSCYERGFGVPKDLEKAAELYRQASDDGHSLAQHNLAVFYERGLGGLVANEQEATKWFEKAVANGCVELLSDIKRLEESKGDGVPAQASYATSEQQFCETSLSENEAFPSFKGFTVESFTDVESDQD